MLFLLIFCSLTVVHRRLPGERHVIWPDRVGVHLNRRAWRSMSLTQLHAFTRRRRPRPAGGVLGEDSKLIFAQISKVRSPMATLVEEVAIGDDPLVRLSVAILQLISEDLGGDAVRGARREARRPFDVGPIAVDVADCRRVGRRGHRELPLRDDRIAHLRPLGLAILRLGGHSESIAFIGDQIGDEAAGAANERCGFFPAFGGAAQMQALDD